MKKKVLIAFLSVVFILCACQNSQQAAYNVGSITTSDNNTQKRQVIFATQFLAPYEAAISLFNETNLEYEIVVKDYSVYENGQAKLKEDIMAGQGPDIVDLASFSCDLFLMNSLDDLLPYIEADNIFGVDDFLPGPFNAMKVDGKLLSIAPLYSVQTLLCSAITENNAYYYDFNNFISAFPDPNQTFDGLVTKEIFLSYAFCSCNGSLEWILNNDEIKVILQYAKDLPDKPEIKKPDDITLQNPIFIFKALSSVNTLRSYKYNYFGSDVSIEGFPFYYKENTGLIVPAVEVGMLSCSSVKDGVWQFVKILLSDSFCLPHSMNFFPLLKKQYDYCKTTDDMWINKSGMLFYSEIDDNAVVKITDNSDQKLCDYLLSQPCGIYHPNDEIYSIVMYYATQFFNGAITSDEAAGEITKQLIIYYESSIP